MKDNLEKPQVSREEIIKKILKLKLENAEPKTIKKLQQLLQKATGLPTVQIINPVIVTIRNWNTVGIGPSYKASKNNQK